MEQPILFEVENQVALIKLNRPKRSNAITLELLSDLYDRLDEVSASDNIRVAIITGNGKSFCSGLDLSVFDADTVSDSSLADMRCLTDVFGECQKPLIGAVNGHAITGGFEIALNCDFLIASELASFADTHAKVGIQPGWGMSQLLQQAVGQRMAKQMSFTGQFISAQQAFMYGLVNEVVSPEDLISRAKQIASEICAVNQDILKIVKDLIEYRNSTTLDEACAHERKSLFGK
jgi:enoyl-CoA hydratase